jgi:hypothetical protein
LLGLFVLGFPDQTTPGSNLSIEPRMNANGRE